MNGLPLKMASEMMSSACAPYLMSMSPMIVIFIIIYQNLESYQIKYIKRHGSN